MKDKKEIKKIMLNIQIVKFILFKDSVTVHIACVMCHKGIELLEGHW